MTDEEFEAWKAEQVERAAAIEGAKQAREQQDVDFHAFGVTIIPHIECIYSSGGESPPSQWAASEDDEGAAAEAMFAKPELLEQSLPQIIAAARPWIDHYSSIGFIRADGLSCHDQTGMGAPNFSPAFYMVCRAETADLSPAVLGEFPQQQVSIEGLPAPLTVCTDVTPMNATRLYQALAQYDAPLGEWGGVANHQLLPCPGEARDDFLERVSIDRDQVSRLLERWHGSGCDPSLFGMLGTSDERSTGHEEISWVVEGRIPRGCVTLIAGNSGSGKSSFAHEIAGALGRVDYTTPCPVFGTEVVGKFVVALISGEDPAAVINHRARAHSTIWGPSSYFVIDGIGQPLKNLLGTLERASHLDLVVVDPVRAALDGDEDSSDVISNFYNQLNQFARNKNCAVIAVHHLKKGIPKSLRHLKEMVRGSGVHIDRARMVIGVLDRGNGLVEIGPINFNFPSEMVWLALYEGQLFERQATTFTLKPVISKLINGTTHGAVEVTADQVLAMIANRNQAGIIVRRTGKSGLFESRAVELAGLSRNAILTAIEALAGAGRITDGEMGLVAISSATPSGGTI